MRRSGVVALGEVTAWWTLLVALYLTFITTVTVLEFAVGAAGSALAAVAARAVRRAAESGTGGRGRWPAALLSWPGAVLADTVRLTAVTARGLRGERTAGRFHTLRLRPGTGAAWAAAALSATPGAYVVDVGRGETPTLRVHVLTGEPTALERALTTGGRR